MPPSEVVSLFGMSPVQVIDLGVTHVDEAAFRDFVAGIRSRFTPETYNLFTNNCNNFSDVCSEFLVGAPCVPVRGALTVWRT